MGPKLLAFKTIRYHTEHENNYQLIGLSQNFYIVASLSEITLKILDWTFYLNLLINISFNFFNSVFQRNRYADNIVHNE